MKKRVFAGLAALLLALLVISIPSVRTVAQETGGQVLLNLRFINAGPSTQGANVLQTGQVGTLSAAVATTTLTEVVAAPSTGSIYLLGVWVEKATATTGNVLVRYGTGTNCATGVTTLLSIGVGSPAIGYYPVNAQVPAAKALCLETDASTTSARALTN